MKRRVPRYQRGSNFLLMEAPRYLTKSRFKLGLECPVKLFYTKKAEYFDARLEDDFLQALAEGGFQVGELAKLYYPGGINIDELDYETALAKTDELLQRPDVIIYEAAFRYQNLFVRTDLLVKKGDQVEVIEVKAKAFDPLEGGFLNAHDYIIPKWRPYLYDAAFQKHVVANAYPSFQVSASLYLVDKTQTTSVDGLNQKFFLFKKDGRKQVKVNGPTDAAALGTPLLTKQNIDGIIERIYEGTDAAERDALSFTERIGFFSEQYANNEKIDSPLGAGCKDCEFRMEREDAASGLRSGFHECWREKAGFADADFDKPLVLDIWNCQKRDELIKGGMYFQEEVDPESLKPKKSSPQKDAGLSRWERQALQLKKSRDNDPTHFIDIPALGELRGEWKFPYHFIDFETMAAAIPFTRGRRPYEPVAFQFSHHILAEDGTIEHKGQWINAEPGHFPNFDFARALKKELSVDEGTIFRYATHENSILNTIYRQLMASGEEDRQTLCEWIKTISHSGNDSVEKWKGSRDMIDLKEVIQKFYYSPLTKGSISIKQVMPAILTNCIHLRQKYAQPIYGRQIKSLNFTDWQWVRYETGTDSIINPYQLLPAVFEGVGNRMLDSLLDEDSSIAEGGAAMTAYARMQFTEMSGEERDTIIRALLKYCELDTFAMVLVWEGLAYWISGGK